MSRDVCPKCGSATALGDTICFKCGFKNSTYRHTTGFSLAATHPKAEFELPVGLILNPHQFPPAALRWLYNACVYNDTIVKQRIGYCQQSNRVFIPAFDNEELKFYQLRSLEPDARIKYLTVGRTASYLIHYNDHTDDKVVIVEDHLSAIRLRKFSNVIALSGTTLSHNNCKELIHKYKTFIFWLDPDLPGRRAFYKNLERLKRYTNSNERRDLFLGGATNNYIFKRIDYDTIKVDPKCIRDSRIANIIINEVLSC